MKKVPGNRKVLEENYPECMVMDGYDDCIMGIVERFGCEPFVLYNKEKVLKKLVKGGCSELEAIEWYEYNMLGSYVGECTPGFFLKLDEVS